MNKVLMEILGLSTSPSSGGAYALILTEAEGSRRLPIIIGSFEAQAIALELENIKPPRPMTHDLLKNIVLGFDSQIKHIVINELSQGTFYALITFERDAQLFEMDARPSDAIALSVRFGAPIYVNETVLKEAGIQTDPDPEPLEETVSATEEEQVAKGLSQLEELEEELKTAIDRENYEKAAKIRDRISKLKG
ncbi:MAG: bifunctional nuclease family protein [Bacteroidota bacterium]